jgi:monoamine oxidase
MISAAPSGKSSTTVFDLVIVGGGLSGLFICNGLIGQSRIKHWMILEASNRLGGRLVNASPSQHIDMGGAWIWPDHQPLVRDLVLRFGLSTFAQPDDPSSIRIEGGAARFIDKLSEQIKSMEKKGTVDNEDKVGSRIALNTPVSACELLAEHHYTTDGHALVQVTTGSGSRYIARKVIFAVPPKILHDNVSFNPPLSDAKRSAMSTSRTWMAGVTKVALVYPYRFWDLEYSNSGLGKSIGPAFQVYDSSTNDGNLAALTFFSHIPPDDESAQMSDEIVAKQVAQQMAQFWKYRGKPEYSSLATSYNSFYVYRWPINPFICDETRPTHIHPHPSPVRALSSPEWDGKLLFAGTETDLKSPGVMEGAIGAAQRVLESLFE